MNKYNTFWRRVFAATFDSFIVFLIGLINILIPFKSMFVEILFLVFSHTLFFIYSIWMHWKYGQTIGKIIMDVVVVDVNDEKKITFKQALYRDIVYVIMELIALGLNLMLIVNINLEGIIGSLDSVLGVLVFLWLILELITMLFNQKRRSLHDLIANTVVVKKEYL